MSRLVTPKPVGATAFSTGGNSNQAVKEALERLAKYVPAEVIAGYIAVLPVVTGTTTGTLRTVLLAVLFVGCLVFTPFYLNLMATVGQPRRVHMVMGTVAFVVWTYSIGGFFHDIGWYQAGVAAILLTFFTLASGLVVPTEGTK